MKKKKIDIYAPTNGDDDVIVNYVNETKKTTSLYDSSKLKTRDKYGVFLGREYISYRYKDSVYEPEETACGERFICRLLYSVLNSSLQRDRCC